MRESTFEEAMDWALEKNKRFNKELLMEFIDFYNTEKVTKSQACQKALNSIFLSARDEQDFKERFKIVKSYNFDVEIPDNYSKRKPWIYTKLSLEELKKRGFTVGLHEDYYYLHFPGGFICVVISTKEVSAQFDFAMDYYFKLIEINKVFSKDELFYLSSYQKNKLETQEGEGFLSRKMYNDLKKKGYYVGYKIGTNFLTLPISTIPITVDKTDTVFEGKIGLADTKGNIILEPKYDKIIETSCGNIIQLNGKFGYLTDDCKVILECIYQDVSEIIRRSISKNEEEDQVCFFVKEDDVTYLLNYSGEKIYKFNGLNMDNVLEVEFVNNTLLFIYKDEIEFENIKTGKYKKCIIENNYLNIELLNDEYFIYQKYMTTAYIYSIEELNIVDDQEFEYVMYIPELIDNQYMYKTSFKNENNEVLYYDQNMKRHFIHE